ncbi:hypothetical protein J6590_063172 [Homalodisca vitripennis]|nr:hypothetical protein J6590_063172 [Homalodisca vitripennis]
MLNTFKGEMVKITVSINFLSDTVDTANNLTSELRDRVRAMEHYNRRTNIEISEVPVTPQEGIVSIVKDVGATIGV